MLCINCGTEMERKSESQWECPLCKLEVAAYGWETPSEWVLVAGSVSNATVDVYINDDDTTPRESGDGGE